MGKKSRRQRPTNPVLPKPAAPTANSLGTGTSIPSSEIRVEPSNLDEAKAEFICAAATAEFSRMRRAGGLSNWLEDPRFNEAVCNLCAFVRIENAGTREIGAIDYFDDYLAGQRSFAEPEDLYKAIMRWPRYQKYWPRLRRRLCWGCGKQYDLSAPRLWVCAGCGEARYCDETCQRAHWPAHQGMCCDPLIKATPGVFA